MLDLLACLEALLVLSLACWALCWALLRCGRQTRQASSSQTSRPALSNCRAAPRLQGAGGAARAVRGAAATRRRQRGYKRFGSASLDDAEMPPSEDEGEPAPSKRPIGPDDELLPSWPASTAAQQTAEQPAAGGESATCDEARIVSESERALQERKLYEFSSE